MEYVYSALLLHNAKQPVNEENVKKVLQAAGITPEEGKIKALVASLEGVNIDDAISQAAMHISTTATKEEKKEEKKEEEKKPEEAAAGLSALFG
jgi:large subunit ribosomal protein L12